MTNYHKYLPVSDEDKSWGLFVLNAGCSRIASGAAYPPGGHPSDHQFSYEQGRMFNEFQLLYILKGSGVFESKSAGQLLVKAGAVMILFPGEWHRFKPDVQTGWDEFWVGFNGPVAENLVRQNFISVENPLIHIDIHDTIFCLFEDIIRITQSESPGYQPLVSGIVLHLLGLMHALSKQANIKHENISEILISKARIMLRAGIDQNVSVESIADELNVGYSWFRKAFKLYTGMAPGQYLLQLKIDRAKMLLADPSKSVKQVAFELHFESVFYFSKLFKNKTGLSPDAHRKYLLKSH